MKITVYVLVFVTAIATAWFLARMFKRWTTRQPAQSPGTSPPSGSGQITTAFKWVVTWIIPLTLVIAFAAMLNWRNENAQAKAAWGWLTTNWVFSLTIFFVGLIVWFTLKGKGGGHGERFGIGSLKELAVTGLFLAGVFALVYIPYSCNSHFIRVDEAAMVAAEKAQPPERPPYEIETDPIPDELIPPGGHSSWVIWYPRYLTDTRISAPARYIKGRANEKGEVVVRDPTPKWEYPDKPDGMSDWDAQMYFNEGTTILRIQKFRRLR